MRDEARHVTAWTCAGPAFFQAKSVAKCSSCWPGTVVSSVSARKSNAKNQTTAISGCDRHVELGAWQDTAQKPSGARNRADISPSHVLCVQFRAVRWSSFNNSMAKGTVYFRSQQSPSRARTSFQGPV